MSKDRHMTSEREWPDAKFYEAPDDARISSEAMRLCDIAASDHKERLYDGAWSICHADGRKQITADDAADAIKRLTPAPAQPEGGVEDRIVKAAFEVMHHDVEDGSTEHDWERMQLTRKVREILAAVSASTPVAEGGRGLRQELEKLHAEWIETVRRMGDANSDSNAIYEAIALCAWNLRDILDGKKSQAPDADLSQDAT